MCTGREGEEEEKFEKPPSLLLSLFNLSEEIRRNRHALFGHDHAT
jgi:hypothetical protein